MSRYIDADELKETMLYGMCGTGYQTLALSLIEEVPSADVEPVRHGHWIDYDDDIVSCECSACHKKFNLYEDDVNGYSYCPHCGARMDGEKE